MLGLPQLQGDLNLVENLNFILTEKQLGDAIASENNATFLVTKVTLEDSKKVTFGKPTELISDGFMLP